MLFSFFLAFQQVFADCIENSYLTYPNQEEWVYAVKRISVKLEGEYVIGFGDNYEVKDKSKIQIKQVPGGLTFGPSNFQIYCPAIHKLSQKDIVQCEIQLNMKEINATSIPSKAQFVFSVELDNELKENPVFQIETNFQMRLMDFAKQLENMAYYLEYENCDQIVYLLPDPLPISSQQINLLQKYSKTLSDDASTQPIIKSIKGQLFVENFSIDSSSNSHLYGLIAIIIGVIILAAIRAFNKKREAQNQYDPSKQPLNEQELHKLT
ncbi:unnamed protein product [Paramecium sonneborni]|uniref:Transmembrane protein n=1 Tax=Paramecium sonneborni TaxID=65129 RepID=A0A8S1RII6_9CILI|nr:unnamed protein product [Paramecium sonneborni]CAD8127093.1 unnamed protein product [Paramecium sonneborni]